MDIANGTTDACEYSESTCKKYRNKLKPIKRNLKAKFSAAFFSLTFLLKITVFDCEITFVSSFDEPFLASVSTNVKHFYNIRMVFALVNVNTSLTKI